MKSFPTVKPRLTWDLKNLQNSWKKAFEEGDRVVEERKISRRDVWSGKKKVTDFKEEYVPCSQVRKQLER